MENTEVEKPDKDNQKADKQKKDSEKKKTSHPYYPSDKMDLLNHHFKAGKIKKPTQYTDMGTVGFHSNQYKKPTFMGKVYT
ncbi:MAG: hypothetical protein PHO23_01610 [Candidatus Pacebacteria bacterium]|nr:hypothetical protein [Candidatus Paceibacterota bacterium]